MPINTQSFGNSQAHSDSDQRDNGSVTHKQNTHINVSDIRKYLEGAQFPANKNELTEYASQHRAPREVVDLLQQLPTPEFGSGNDTKLTEYNNLDELMEQIDQVQ